MGFRVNSALNELSKKDTLIEERYTYQREIHLSKIKTKFKYYPLDQTHGCSKSHIAEIKRFFIFVRRSGTSLASKCKHGSSLDIMPICHSYTLNKCYSVTVFAPNDVGKGDSFIHKCSLRKIMF